MQYIYVENNNNSKTRALVLPQYEWKRLKKVITKKEDDRIAFEEAKRLKDEQAAKSKSMAATWESTTLNKRKKQLEEKKKFLAEVEARQREKDKELKLELLKRQKMIVEKARKTKWSDKDSTKALTKAKYKMEVLKERALQVEFNEKLKSRALEEQCVLQQEQNLEVDQYRKDRLDQIKKEAEMKKANADYYLDELKKREEERTNEKLKSIEDGKTELRRIAKEIEEEKEKEKARVQATKDRMWESLRENREIVAQNNKLRQMEEQDENTLVAIMAESKKKIAKTIKIKDIEFLREKQMVSQRMTEKATKKEANKKIESDLAFQKAVDEKDAQFRREQLQEEELAKKRKKAYEEYRRMLEEESRMEKERLELSHRWELERRNREARALCDIQELQRQAKINDTNTFRESLDIQCENNRMANMANKQVDQQQYETLIKIWREEDEAFMAYAKDLIKTYEKSGRSVTPLFRAVESYVKNNKLLVNAAKQNYEVVKNVLQRKTCL